MAQKTITTILILLVIGGLAWYVNKTYLNQTASEPQAGTSNPLIQASGKDAAFVYLISGNAKEIWMKDLGGKLKKIFTDADESEKLIKVSNLAASNQKILAITNKDPKAGSGKLILINLGSGAKETLQSTFSRPLYWSITQDAEKIAYIKFSNTEENYGYTLYIEQNTGSDQQKLFNSSSEIRSPAWDTLGSKVAFAASSGTEGQIKIVNVSSKDVSTLKSFEGKIVDWLSWVSDRKIVFSLRNIGSHEGSLETIEIADDKMNKVADFSGGQANFIFSSADEKFLCFLVAQYNQSIDDKTNGQIFIENLKDSSQKAMGKAIQILGWLQ